MALLHNAQLSPSKLELLSGWVPSQPWWAWNQASLEAVGAYRFDDPADEVGIETHLLRVAGGPIVQVPLTYRGAPLESAQAALISTMQHSVLGRRWVYDACFDPVYASALATTILTGGRQADLQYMSEGRIEPRESTTLVSGSGSAAGVTAFDAVSCATDETDTTIQAATLELVLRRVLDDNAVANTEGDALTLTGVWPGNEQPVILALAHIR